MVKVNEKFDKAELEDGSKVSNEEAGKFAIGQTLFIEDKDGNMVKAPEGEHVSTSGIQFILDKDSKITGLKYPDAKGEGSADLKEDKMVEEDKDPQAKELIKKGDKSDEGAFASKEDMIVLSANIPSTLKPFTAPVLIYLSHISLLFTL